MAGPNAYLAAGDIPADARVNSKAKIGPAKVISMNAVWVHTQTSISSLWSRNFGIHLEFWDSQKTPRMVIFGSLGIGPRIPLEFDNFKLFDSAQSVKFEGEKARWIPGLRDTQRN
jgi:hypothetical protein